MVGDDLFDDILGAKSIGLRTIFIEGTYSRQDLERNSVRPDFILLNLAEIRRIMDRLE